MTSCAMLENFNIAKANDVCTYLALNPLGGGPMGHFSLCASAKETHHDVTRGGAEHFSSNDDIVSSSSYTTQEEQNLATFDWN
eukprot:6050871-Amphidinium_carterae.1